MKHLVNFLLIALVISTIFFSCQKEETTVDTPKTVSPSADTYSDSTLNLILSNGGLKSGLRFSIYGRESHTKTNYLLGGVPGFIPKETAFNTDSVSNVTLKRYVDEVVNIGQVLHGVFVVTHTFYNRPEESEICFVRDTTVDNFVIETFNYNYAKNVANIITYERETSIPAMSYYDFDFRKWKSKSRYRVNTDTYGYRDFIPSRSANTNTLRLPIQ